MAIVGEAHVIVKAITTGFERQIQNAIRNANLGGQGSAAGKAFSKSFSSGASGGFKKFSQEAEAARAKLMALTRAGFFVGPAIAGAASALASLVSGLFAMSSQILSALPSLIVLPSIFTAMGQAMLTAKLAFSGVGKAIGALNKGTKGGVDKMPAILERITAAQRRLELAERRTKESTEALTDAREKAKEALEQLTFDSEDAALAEKKAALELEKARKTLLRVQDLPPNSAARKEAELAYQEADLEYRRAIDRNKDLAAEAKKRTEAGIEGSDEVLDAIQNEQDAIYEETQAEKALAKAILEKKKAQSGGGGGEDPLAGLSKEAASFAKFISDLKPRFDELKASAGKELFPALEIAIGNLATKLFPMLNDILRETGKSLGIAAIDFSNIFTEASNLANIDRVADTNRDTIEKLGTVVGNLASAFLSVLAAADPLVRRFTDWLVVITGGWKATAEANREAGILTDKFNLAGDAAAQIGRILGNLYTAIRDIGRAASGPGSGGQMLMDSFEGATERFEEFVKKISADGSLQQYFRDIVPTFEAIGRFIVALGAEFLKLGDNKGTKQLIDSLTNTVPTIGRILDTMSEGAPALGTFIEKFALLIETFVEAGSIKTFFAVMNQVLDVLLAVFGNAVIAKIFGFVAVLTGVAIALGTTMSVIGFYGKAVFGAIAKVVGLGNATKGAATIQKLWNAIMHTSWLQTKLLQIMYAKDAIAKKIAAGATKAWTGIQAAFNAVMMGNPIALVVLAIVALVAIIIIAYKKVEWFRDLVDGAFALIKDAIVGVFNWVRDNWQTILAILTGPIGLAVLLIVTHWDTIKGAVMAVFNWIRDNWKTILVILTGPIGLAVALIVTHWGTIKGAVMAVFNWIRDNWRSVLGFFTAPITGIVDAFLALGERLRGILKGVINFLIRGWNNLEFRIPGFKLGAIKFDGITLGLPNIPELADGGVVAPTRGGTLALIGEAGRPERVEPLDADGLSKRDKALISMMTGGTGGATINVYPSPGMDEVELASLVNRQISFQLRKGAA